MGRFRGHAGRFRADTEKSMEELRLPGTYRVIKRECKKI
jgi:hypothetical protein